LQKKSRRAQARLEKKEVKELQKNARCEIHGDDVESDAINEAKNGRKIK